MEKKDKMTNEVIRLKELFREYTRKIMEHDNFSSIKTKDVPELSDNDIKVFSTTITLSSEKILTIFFRYKKETDKFYYKINDLDYELNELVFYLSLVNVMLDEF